MRGGLLLLLPPFKAGRIGRACQRTSHIIIARTERNYLLNEKGRSSEELNLSYLPSYYSSRESFSSSGHNTIAYIITPPPFPTIPIATPTKQPSPPILHFPLLDLPFPLSALPPYPPPETTLSCVWLPLLQGPDTILCLWAAKERGMSGMWARCEKKGGRINDANVVLPT